MGEGLMFCTGEFLCMDYETADTVIRWVKKLGGQLDSAIMDAFLKVPDPAAEESFDSKLLRDAGFYL